MRFCWAFVLAGCGFHTSGASSSEVDAQVDATAIFDPATCPASYDVALPGPSKYRLITAAAKLDAQNAACNADLPGATHLVVPSSTTELTAISDYLDRLTAGTLHDDSLWIGAVQVAGATQRSAGWIDFSDRDLIHGWATGEPNDGGAVEDATEQFASMKRNKHYLTDSPASSTFGALCECDGVPIGPRAMAAITAQLPR